MSAGLRCVSCGFEVDHETYVAGHPYCSDCLPRARRARRRNLAGRVSLVITSLWGLMWALALLGGSLVMLWLLWSCYCTPVTPAP